MSSRRGPPKHQNRYAWKPNSGKKVNETEVGGKFKPYSEITGVCHRCREQIDWKRRYGKYKPLTEPGKCQQCSKRNVRQAYHNLCSGCAKEQNVCAKCRCHVDQIIGRDSAEVEAEQKMLEEAIKNARERDRRTLLRAMNKDKSKSSGKITTNKENGRVGELFPETSLEEYAKQNIKEHHVNHDDENDDHCDDNDDRDYDSEASYNEDLEDGENNEDEQTLN
ncbi:hypothetical protein SLA2020_170090 [Shorea laevis]